MSTHALCLLITSESVIFSSFLLPGQDPHPVPASRHAARVPAHRTRLAGHHVREKAQRHSG